MSKLMDMFPDFPLHSSDQLGELSAKELVDVFNKINEINEGIKEKNIQIKTQLESAELEMKKIEEEIFKKYEIKSLSDLENLKDAELVKFQESFENLVNMDI